MPPKYKRNRSSDDDSDNSLMAEIDRRQNQRKITNYLSDDIRESPQANDIDTQLKPNHQRHAGFSNASDFFRPHSKQIPNAHIRQSFYQKEQTKPLSQSTVTVSNQNIKLKDSKPNLQVQKPILKDIQDLGKDLKGSCNGCEQKNQTGGLNYKQRNKRLIQDYDQRVRNQKNQTQKEEGLKTPDKKEVPKENRKVFNNLIEHQKQKEIANKFLKEDNNLKEQEDNNFEQLMKQFQYSQYKNDLPENLIQAEVKNIAPPKKNQIFIIDKNRSLNQQRLQISKHTVYFPYKPYDAQINYMEKVLQSLDRKQNAILESPTGTGKTLCLLSAALSWVQNEFWKNYKEVPIIYLSRTHSQLAQVSKELEKTCFRPTMATFGSRDIFCVKQNFNELKGRQKVEACSKAVKLFLRYGKEDRGGQQRRHVGLRFDEAEEQNNDGIDLPTSQKKLSDLPSQEKQKIQDAMCDYYKGQRYVLDLARRKFKNRIISNEKIKQLGKIEHFCPYYYPNFIKPICNLFLMPYNYLLDCGLNSKYASIVKDSILIFDEAHNVPESSCEGWSFSINKRTFEDAQKQLTKLIKGQKMSNQLFLVRNDYEDMLSTLQYEIKRIFNAMCNFVNDTEFPSNPTVTEDDSSLKKLFNIHETEQKIYEFLYEKLNDAERKIFMNLSNDKAQKELIQKMIKDIEQNIYKLSQLCQDLTQTPDGIFQNMQKVAGFVKRCMALIRSDDKKWIDRQVNHFRVVVIKNDKHWEVSLACLVPFLTMKSIMDMGPRNIILTSGTLSPIETWPSQLGIPFQIRFTNTHVIQPSQLMLRIVTNNQKQTFNFSYNYTQQNFKTIYLMTLRSITQLAENIPNGMLVVTPSYKILNNLERCLQYNPDLKKRLASTKKIFTQSKDDYEGLIKAYRKAAVEQKGAILFCVCRGKISQGIDFPDELCRAVIFVGIPFPNVSDIIINEKKGHYDRIGQRDSTYKFSGNKWYENQTFRSVNQAIGRVIRHVNDYGSIFLLDIRYNMPGYKSQLPKWSQSSLKTIEFKPQVLDELSEFYQQMKTIFVNYEEEKKINNTKKQKQWENDSFSEGEQPMKQKYQKSSQQSQQTKLHKKEEKFEEKKYNQKLNFHIPRKQPEKQVQKNAFTAIMGTNQNKFPKKKANF